MFFLTENWNVSVLPLWNFTLKAKLKSLRKIYSVHRLEASIFLASNVASQDAMHFCGLLLNARETHVDLPTFNADV